MSEVKKRSVRDADGGPAAVRLGVLLALLVGAAVGWHKWARHQLFPRNFGVVEPGAIYRSGRNTAPVLRDLCEDLEIRTILDLGSSKDEARVARAIGIDRYEFHLPGNGAGDPDQYVRVLELMTDPDRQPVLVHCTAGAQRTSIAVLLYRALVEGQPISVAYPESFEYEHEPDEWKLLAYVADNLDYIRDSFESRAGAAGRRPATPPNRSDHDG